MSAQSYPATSLANRDAAQQSLEVALKAHAAGELERALKFARKSYSLHETPEAKKLLTQLELPEAREERPAPPPARAPAPAPAQAAAAPAATGEAAASSSSTPAAAGQAASSNAPEDVVARVSAAETFYEVFGVTSKAPEAVIKKTYRRLAASLHPDKNTAPGAEEAFKKVGEALQTLTDPIKRFHYDMSLQQSKSGPGQLGKSMAPSWSGHSNPSAAGRGRGGATAPPRPSQQHSQWMPMGQPHPQTLPPHVPPHSLFQLRCHACQSLLQVMLPNHVGLFPVQHSVMCPSCRQTTSAEVAPYPPQTETPSEARASSAGGASSSMPRPPGAGRPPPPQMQRPMQPPGRGGGRGAPVMGPGKGMPMPGKGAPGRGMPIPGKGAPMPGIGVPPGKGLPPGKGVPVPGKGVPVPGKGVPVPGKGVPVPGKGVPVPGKGAAVPGKGAPAGKGAPPQSGATSAQKRKRSKYEDEDEESNDEGSFSVDDDDDDSDDDSDDENGEDGNKNECHYCGEIGELICCDGCPRVFHFECLIPPMRKADMPKGDWYCPLCKQVLGEDDEREAAARDAALNGTPSVVAQATCAPPNAEAATAPSGAQWQTMGAAP